LGFWDAALAPGVEGLALEKVICPVAAIPGAGVEGIRGAEVVLEDDGELGDAFNAGEVCGGEGDGGVDAGVSAETAEAVAVDGLGIDSLGGK
jgi:hypothetical protein